MYKLNLNKNGKVNALLKSENDRVKTELPEENAREIIDDGKIVESDIKDYGIAVGDWYFDGTADMPVAVEEVEEEVVTPVRSSKSPFSRK